MPRAVTGAGIRRAGGLATGLTIAVAALATPGRSSAVLVTQHPILKPSPSIGARVPRSIIDGPQGLLVAGALSSKEAESYYQTVVTNPAFAVLPGPLLPPVPASKYPQTQPAERFFAGPGGQVWFVGGTLRLTPATNPKTEKPEMVPKVFQTLNALVGAQPVGEFEFPKAIGEGNTPFLFAPGSDGAIWMTDLATGEFDRYVPGGSMSSVSLPIVPSRLAQLVLGPDGSLWASDIVKGAVARISPDGTVVGHPLPGGFGFGSYDNTEPYGLAFGPEGDLWFTEQNAGRIGDMTPDGTLQTFPIPSASGRHGLEAGAPAPRNLTIGPEGAVWFTDPGDNSIGRVANGQVTEYPIPSNIDVAVGEIVSAGSELWFTEGNCAVLGSVSPTAAADTSGEQAPLTSAQVARQLTVPRGQARSRTILENGGYTAIVGLPTAGEVVIRWYTAAHTPVLVASGHTAFHAATSEENIEIKLTSRGRKLLKRHAAAHLVAKGVFTLECMSPPVEATASLRLRR